MTECTLNLSNYTWINTTASAFAQSMKQTHAKVKAILPIQVLKQTNLGCFDFTHLRKIYAWAIK